MTLLYFISQKYLKGWEGGGGCTSVDLRQEFLLSVFTSTSYSRNVKYLLLLSIKYEGFFYIRTYNQIKTIQLTKAKTKKNVETDPSVIIKEEILTWKKYF